MHFNFSLNPNYDHMGQTCVVLTSGPAGVHQGHQTAWQWEAAASAGSHLGWHQTAEWHLAAVKESTVLSGTYRNTRHEQFILMSPLWLNGLFQEHLKEKKAEQCFISAAGTHTSLQGKFCIPKSKWISDYLICMSLHCTKTIKYHTMSNWATNMVRIKYKKQHSSTQHGQASSPVQYWEVHNFTLMSLVWFPLQIRSFGFKKKWEKNTLI